MATAGKRNSLCLRTVSDAVVFCSTVLIVIPHPLAFHPGSISNAFSCWLDRLQPLLSFQPHFGGCNISRVAASSFALTPGEILSVTQIASGVIFVTAR